MKATDNWLDRTLIQGPKFVLVVDEASYVREMKRMGVDDPPGFISDSAHASTHLISGHNDLAAIVCVRIDKSASRLQHHMVLVHEAVHVWQAYRKDIGEDEPSAEFEGYAIQALSQALITDFEKRTKRVRFKR